MTPPAADGAAGPDGATAPGAPGPRFGRTLLERALVGSGVGAATTGSLGILALLVGASVPDALLPLGAATGLVAAWRLRAPVAGAGAAGGRGPTFVVALLLAAAFVLLVHGALATPSRQWDGAVAWDLKANVLTAAPTLQQPFFRDADVYCHSRDYPLLQPLLVALLERWHLPGRLLFPLAWLVGVAAVGAAARAAQSGRTALLFALAAAVTPMWLAPSGGGFDSGYGDGPLCAALALLAFGLTNGRPAALVAGLVLAILQKPEGLPYAALLVAAAWLSGDARTLRAAAFATAAAGTLQLALQHDLRTSGGEHHLVRLAATAAALVAVLLVADATLRRRRAARRWRWLALVPLVPLGLAALWLANAGGDGLLGSHLTDPMRPWQRLDRLPAVASAVVGRAFGHGTFGLAFAVPVVVALVRWRRGQPQRAPVVGLWLLLAVPLWCAPFLTSPLDELDAHLRATLPRLMLHWTGVAWAWAAAQGLAPGDEDALPSHAATP